MADISQITLPSGTTYDIKDAVARAAQGNAKVFYGTCNTTAETVAKIISCDSSFTAQSLTNGTIIFITFSFFNKPVGGDTTFNVNNTGAKNVYRIEDSRSYNDWEAGETVGFIFINDAWFLIDGGIASEANYGKIKLSDSIDSSSSTNGKYAATPKAVKDALDAAKAYADGLDTGVSDVTVDGTSVVTNGIAAVDLSGKVDKVTGKGLSTNDYTTTEKNKLAGIEEGADVNTIESISVNGTTITPDASKNVAITIPAGVDSVNGVTGNV